MKKKHIIKKLTKLYENLDELVYVFLTTSLNEEKFEDKYWELNDQFEKIKGKCVVEKPREVRQPTHSVKQPSLDEHPNKVIINYNDIRDALKEQELKLALSEAALKETRGLTEHPVVASDNPDLWYSDPKHQHNLGGGYVSWAQSKDQAKAMTERRANLDVKDIPGLQEILDTLNKND